MTQHSTRATSPLANSALRSRIVKKAWPVWLALVAALLLAVPLLFHAGSPVHAADKDVTGVTVTSPNPDQLSISWDTPSDAPDDYRVTWKKSSGKWTSSKKANTVQGGNAFPTGTSHSVAGMEEGTAYKVRVRARYHDGNGNVRKSGPWSAAREVTVSATPPPPKKGAEQGEGDSNQGRSTNPPAKPTGLLTGANHDTVILFWTNPDDDTITGYQILRGPDAANLAVLTNDTGDASASYTDDTVTASATNAYAIRARNAHGLSPQSDPVSVTTLAPPPEEDEPLETGEQTLATPSTTRANATVVTLGDVMLQQRHAVAEGNIPSGGNQNQWVRYSVTAGRYYQFEVWGVGQGVNQVGGNLDDPSLRVETISGTLLGWDGNSGDGKNAHLKFFAVTTQDVVFRISDAADPDAGGDYTVLIREERLDGEGTDCRDDRGNPNCNLKASEFDSSLDDHSGSRREGWLSAGDADYWLFSIDGAGFTDKGTIRIWVVQYPPSGAGGLQHPKIELYDNHDTVIAENDHHLGTQRAKVRYKEIGHSGIGIYYLRVSSTDGGAGAYAILAHVYDTP